MPPQGTTVARWPCTTRLGGTSRCRCCTASPGVRAAPRLRRRRETVTRSVELACPVRVENDLVRGTTHLVRSGSHGAPPAVTGSWILILTRSSVLCASPDSAGRKDADGPLLTPQPLGRPPDGSRDRGRGDGGGPGERIE